MRQMNMENVFQNDNFEQEENLQEVQILQEQNTALEKHNYELSEKIQIYKQRFN